MKRKIISIVIALGLLVGLTAIPAQAAPPDGVYDVAVLEVGAWGYWAADDFNQLGVAPGIESYTWATIPTSSLTASGLAPYDVLIVPWHHDYAWLDSSMASAIVAWVDGGKLLIVHNYLFDIPLSNDPLMAAFGSNYRVDWTGEDGGFPGDSVVIVDPTNPLASTPNTLSAAELSNWARSVHNSIDPATAGSAWNWAINSADSGYHWLGYSLSGSGAIVVLAGDPEFHSPARTGASKLIENEIVFEWVPPVIEVDIDIKPGSDPNSINPNGKGVIPVAILGSTTFDVHTVDVTTLDFEGALPAHDLTDPLVYAEHLQDMNGDGYTDLVSHYKVQETGIQAGDTEATLTGETTGGIPIAGTDSVKTVGK